MCIINEYNYSNPEKQESGFWILPVGKIDERNVFFLPVGLLSPLLQYIGEPVKNNFEFNTLFDAWIVVLKMFGLAHYAG